MILPGLGGLTLSGVSFPRYISNTQRAGGVPLGAGTGSFTDTNGMTVPAGSTSAIVGVKSWHSATDANPTGPALTVHGISASQIGTITVDGTGDNANQCVGLWLVTGLTPGAVGTVAYAQGGQNPNQGFIWCAMHFDLITTIEDSAQTNNISQATATISSITVAKPVMVVAGICHSLAAVNTGSAPSPMVSAIDLGYSSNTAVRIQLLYGYEPAPTSAKSYAFGISGGTDSRHGGIVGAVSR